MEGMVSGLKATSAGLSKVVVSADSHDDATMVTGLLSLMGLDEIIVSDSVDSALREDSCAIVYCHRGELGNNVTQLTTQDPNTRVIVLTAHRSESDIVKFYNAGARHVLNIDEAPSLLRVRLCAALRLHSTTADKVLTIGDIQLDIRKRKVLRKGVTVTLSPKEFDFAHHIFSNIEKPVSNVALMTSVWSLPPHMDTRRIDTAACNVRKKLGLAKGEEWELRRVRRVGYKLVRGQKCA